MSRPRTPKRWEGIIGIGDRVAFKMPGERWITAGNVLDITLDQQTLTLENIAGIEGAAITRNTTLTTVLGKPLRGPSALTITIQRGLVIENKTEVRRLEARANRNKNKRGKYAVHPRI